MILSLLPQEHHFGDMGCRYGQHLTLQSCICKQQTCDCHLVISMGPSIRFSHATIQKMHFASSMPGVLERTAEKFGFHNEAEPLDKEAALVAEQQGLAGAVAELSDDAEEKLLAANALNAMRLTSEPFLHAFGLSAWC